MTTQHSNTVPSPEEERMVLDAFYGRVARTVVLLLVAAGLCALVCMVLAPAAFGALGGGLGALLVVKTAGALFLGGLLAPMWSRTAFVSRPQVGRAFLFCALMTFAFILRGETRDAGLRWLGMAAIWLWPAAIIGLEVLRKRSHSAADKEAKTP